MDENGDIQNEKEMPNLSQETLTKVYKTMVLLNVMVKERERGRKKKKMNEKLFEWWAIEWLDSE